MTRTVSAADAKNHFGEITQAAREGEEIIIARHGKGDVAVISTNDLQELHELREKNARAEALRRLERLAEETSRRNQDLTEEESIELAVQIGRELIDEMTARGDITFQRDR
jgi:prevent-host-death family protein